MPRVPRLVIPEVPHHITQRGNFRQQIFFRDEDHRLYLDLLTEFAPKYDLTIQAFCLMPNHVHLIATPLNERALARTLQRVHSDYSRALNLRLRRTGHLWHSRFHSMAMDDEHFWAALVYVEQNPVRAGLAENAEQWRWSSAPLRLAQQPNRRHSKLLDTRQWRTEHTPETWRTYLDYGLKQARQIERIRECTLSGWPLGNENFLEILHNRLGFRPCKRKAGRKPLPRDLAVQAHVQAH